MCVLVTTDIAGLIMYCRVVYIEKDAATWEEDT